jgi:hypothetical protein
LNAAGRINGHHFGLIVVEGAIHVWCHEDTLRDFGVVPEGWNVLGVGAGNRPVRFFPDPLHNDDGALSDALAPASPLVALLSGIENWLVQNPNTPSIENTLEKIRGQMHEQIMAPQGTPAAIYPRLIFAYRRPNGAAPP